MGSIYASFYVLNFVPVLVCCIGATRAKVVARNHQCSQTENQGHPKESTAQHALRLHITLWLGIVTRRLSRTAGQNAREQNEPLLNEIKAQVKVKHAGL